VRSAGLLSSTASPVSAAHQTLMSISPEIVARFKDVMQFLAEDLQNLEKSSE
jgi:hypothetical protein